LILPYQIQHRLVNIIKTVARFSSIGGIYVCAVVLYIPKSDKNCTELVFYISI